MPFMRFWHFAVRFKHTVIFYIIKPKPSQVVKTKIRSPNTVSSKYTFLMYVVYRKLYKEILMYAV